MERLTSKFWALSLSYALSRFTLYVLCAVLFILAPFIVPTYLVSMLTKVLIFAIFALSLNLLWGYTGLISLGHAAYFGVGGYLSTVFILHFGIQNFWISFLCGIVASGLLAGVFGVIALRLSGLYFLMVTLALGQLVFYTTYAWRSITGGSNGIFGISYPDLGFEWFTWNQISFYFFVLLFMSICFYLMYKIVNSPFGQSLRGIRENKRRMRSLGYNVWLHSYITFIIAGMFASVAGVLFSFFQGGMAPDHVSVAASAEALLIILIGGTRVFWGPIVGSVIVILMEYFASLYTPARWPMILGVIFIISVLFLRGGVGLYFNKLWQRRLTIKGTNPTRDSS